MSEIHYLFISFGLSLFTCLLSWWREDGIARDLFLSTIRTIVQLLILGFALSWIFTHPSYLLIFVVSIFMTLNSALHSKTRIKNIYKGIFLDNLVATALTIWPLAIVCSLLLESDQWWKPEHFLPIIGMLLGNVLNGISLGIDQFTHELKSKKEEIISLIALGASTSEATKNTFLRSLKVGLSPILNSMTSMGLVSIPGMMTGQILGGQNPSQAATVQIIIMIFISIGAYLGSMMGIELARKRLFNKWGICCLR